MANRESSICKQTSYVARYLKEFKKEGTRSLHISISTFTESSDSDITSIFEQYCGKDWKEKFQAIEGKLIDAVPKSFKEAKTILTEKDKKFLRDFRKALDKVRKDEKTKDIIKKAIKSHGKIADKKVKKREVLKQPTARMLDIYKRAIPIAYRQEVNDQILSVIFDTITKAK